MTENPSTDLTPYRLLQDPISADGRRFDDASGSEGIHLREYWRVFAKHRNVALAIFLVFVVSTALVVFLMAPLYTATATIQIERQAPQVAPVESVQQTDSISFDKYDFYTTQYEVLESRTIAARVIKALGLENDERFVGSTSPGLLTQIRGWVFGFFRSGNAREYPEEFGVNSKMIDRYLNRLAIDPVRNSRLVHVEYTSKFPELSAAIANRHIQEYVSSNLDQRLEMTLKAKEFLEEELAKSKDRVVAAEVTLNKFRKQSGIVSLDGGRSDIVSERLGDLNERFTEAQSARITLEGQYQLIKKRNYESLPDVIASPLIQQLKQEKSKVESERAEMEKKFKPGYPRMAEVLAREAQLESRLSSEIAKLVSGIESAYLAANNREETLGKKLDQQREAALAQKDVGADYDTLKRDVDTARGLYANLLQRLKDVDVAEQIKVSNVSVVDRAAVPQIPSRPRKRLSLMIAAMLGLAAGVGFAFLLEYMDNTVKTPEEAERKLGLPTLGVVPSFDTPSLSYGAYSYGSSRSSRRNGAGPEVTNGTSGDNKGLVTITGPSSEIIVSRYPKSVISEAYRSIRTAILLSSADHPPQVISFTSGAAGEGKTVSAINQAVVLGQAGGRVLLIDADTRKPRVHRVFKLPNAAGLSTFLTGQSTLDEVIRQVSLSDVPGGNVEPATNGQGSLFVLPSGPLPPNPAELIGSTKMRETIETLRKHFDYIVIDTPPVLPVTDAVLVAGMSDGVVLVVRGQETPIDLVAKSRDRLASARTKILGILLNDVDITTGDYYHYHRYYYSYYAEEHA